MRCTALYLVFNDWSQSNYKIGVSSCPSRRLGEIAVNYEVEPRIITEAWFTCERNAVKAETRWHRFFSEFRTDDHKGDEWFALPSAQRSQISGWMDKSMDFNHIIDWAFQAQLQQLKDYDRKLLHSIPFRHNPPTIDVWRMKKTSLKKFRYRIRIENIAMQYLVYKFCDIFLTITKTNIVVQ